MSIVRRTYHAVLHDIQHAQYEIHQAKRAQTFYQERLAELYATKALIESQLAEEAKREHNWRLLEEEAKKDAEKRKKR